jgi:hypothetical protein|tara:strand:- start:14370 stop:15020 length:651 start_codon:yes stop_codon:yes gene_type:complete
LELVTVKTASVAVRPLFNALSEAHQVYGAYRIGVFLSTIDTEIETMSVESQREFNDFVGCSKTKKVLADYASAISNTSSEILLRALALLFIDVNFFEFSEQQKIRFVSCTNGIDDLKVELFIKLASLPKIDIETVYPIYVINHVNFSELNLKVELDELFSYTEYFLKQGLILKDPRSEFGANFHSPKSSDWSICFAISPTLQRFAALLSKAKYLHG